VKRNEGFGYVVDTSGRVPHHGHVITAKSHQLIRSTEKVV
jgi:hypothetical protein